MINFKDLQLREDYVVVEYNTHNLSEIGKVIKTTLGNQHYLGKEVIVNVRPSDVYVSDFYEDDKRYVIANVSRILAKKI